MPKELILFEKDDLTLEEKFFKYMDLLISNQSISRFEIFFFMIINYIQILSLFYAEQIQVFKPKNNKSDSILNIIEKVLRIKDLFRNNYFNFKVVEYCLFIIMIISIIFFILNIFTISKNSIYSFDKKLNNYFIKIFIYIGYNIILDISFSNFCFGFSEYNPNFEEKVKCFGKNKIFIILISVILIIITYIFHLFLQIYYSDPFFLSTSSLRKMFSNYDIYMNIICLFNSILFTQVNFLTKEFFFIYNLVVSIGMAFYYIKQYLYYDNYINTLAGIFHLVYAWTSIFCIVFTYIDINEKGIIYLFSSIIVGICYFNIKNRIENEIFYKTPLKKFKNPNYLLYFLKVFIKKIIKLEKKNENKVFISSILQVVLEENPNDRCIELINGEIYLPSENKWRDVRKRNVDDIVFLKYFVVLLFNYLLYNGFSFPDLFFNLSMYYLKVMNNYCEAMYYYQKSKELKLNFRQEFSLVRLRLKISETLVEKLKPTDKENISLENLNVSIYYKYDELCHNFIEEINNDIESSLKFWKIFNNSLKDQNFKIDYNKVFKLAEKIQITKKNIEKIWDDLLHIYSGINEFFEFYNDYIEQINNDELKKRDLDSIKKKAVNFSEHLNHNYYYFLFNNDTGIMIANGDKGCEGIIKHFNKKVEYIFKYNNSELKELNINKLMPKLYDKKHSKYIERYFRIGHKKYIETKDFKSFGKDKNNSIIQIRIALKLFPILNYNVFFVSLIIKDNIDDIILIDENFNIQGMSSKIMKILNINNKSLFQDNNIPFYVICKKFINFYNIFMKNKKKKQTLSNENQAIKKVDTSDKDKINNLKLYEEKQTILNGEESEKEEVNENIEINENVELEFEIKLPQFLINYSNKTTYKTKTNFNKTLSIMPENHIYIESEDDDDENNNDSDFNSDEENNLLGRESTKKVKILDSISTINISTPSTPTPIIENPNPAQNLYSSKQNIKKKKSIILQNKIKMSRKSEEEKIFLEKIEEYQNLFNEGKFEDLEDLIDFCNKDSNLSEFKFNFTFDVYKFGKDGLSYIVRCIDNKNQIGLNEEKSIEIESKTIKYKKEKEKSIKPLYELLEEERKQILELPEKFLKLSSENSEFKKLLNSCKNEIIAISKTQGLKKDNKVLEDENFSQTSNVGFDNGLVKKNRIEEIRSNLFNKVSKYYTLKYIKLIVILISLFSIAFCVIYFLFILNLNKNLNNVSLMNLELYQTALWTSQIISIFISLKILFLKKFGKINYDFLNYQTEVIKTNDDYYKEMEKLAYNLYNQSNYYFGQLELLMPDYFPESQLLSIYWDHINISYIKSDYIRNNRIAEDSFPSSIAQFLSQSINFLKKYNISNLNQINFDYENEEYFNYTTYLIIENAYDNILPSIFIKLQSIPKIFSEHNYNKKNIIYLILSIYIICIFILCLLYFLMVHSTNIAMTEVLKKITKIKFEKIEETIRKIEIFKSILKNFRERDLINSEDNYQNEENDEQIFIKSPSFRSSFLDSNSSNKISDKKNEVESLSSLNENNGFNTDTKNYFPLTIITEYLSYCIFIFIIVLGFVFLICYYSLTIIKNVNQLLLIDNYIYGKLISISVNILEVKCFINECDTNITLNYSHLKSTENIQEIIEGLKHFSNINDYYNNKFLLNACDAAIDKNTQKNEYDICKNDSIIIRGNNTDNILKLIENIIDNIYNKDKMEEGTIKTLPNGTNIIYYRQLLFNDTDFQRIENIFYKYIYSVDYIYKNVINNNLHDFLEIKRYILVILIICLTLIIIIFNIIFLWVYIPKLVYLLTVSRCVLKIIPTSIIINTPELEDWIEN